MPLDNTGVFNAFVDGILRTFETECSKALKFLCVSAFGVKVLHAAAEHGRNER